MKMITKVSGLAVFYLMVSCLLSQAETVTFQRGASNQFVQDYTGVADAAVVDSRGANFNYGGRNTTFVGMDKAGQINRTLIRFDLTSMAGKNIVVTKAVLKLKPNIVIGEVEEKEIFVYRLSTANAGWIEGFGMPGRADAGDSTWNRLNAPRTAWAGSAGLSTPETDFLTPAIATLSLQRVGTGGPAYEFEFNDVSFIADWINGTNPGLLLFSTDLESMGAGNCATLITSEYPREKMRPELELEYKVNP